MKFRLSISLVASALIIFFCRNTINAQIWYHIDSITVSPQFSTIDNIPIRIDGKILSSTYGVGDSTLNIIADTIFIDIEFINGFGTSSDYWTMFYTLSPMIQGKYIIKCRAQITNPQHYILTVLDSFIVIEQSGIKEIDSSFDRAFLHQNCPNPASVNTEISFEINKQGKYILAIYDLQARMIIEIIDEYSEGSYSLKINTTNINNGIYFYSLKGQQVCETKKMIIQK